MFCHYVSVISLVKSTKTLNRVYNAGWFLYLSSTGGNKFLDGEIRNLCSLLC